MLYMEFLQATNATKGKQAYKAYQKINEIYMNDDSMTKQEAYELYKKPTRNRKKNTVNGIKVLYFDSMNSFEEYRDENDYEYNEVNIVYDGEYISTDMTIDCKRYKTAINRFFKGLENIPNFKDWKDGIMESCDNGYFFDEDKTWDYDKKCLVWARDYHWHVEQQEDVWYIECTVNINL